MRIAVYSGSFDPMGSHHINVVKHLLNYVDRVWIFPCYVSYYGKTLTDALHRKKMCEMVISAFCSESDRHRIIVSDLQIVHKIGRTYDLIKKLRELYPMEEFYVAQGIDNALTINQWYRWEELVTTVPFIVVPRMGYEMKIHQWFMEKPHLYICENTDNNGSSTEIRKLIKENKSISQYVGKDSEMYIKENKLYSPKE